MEQVHLVDGHDRGVGSRQTFVDQRPSTGVSPFIIKERKGGAATVPSRSSSGSGRGSGSGEFLSFRFGFVFG